MGEFVFKLPDLGEGTVEAEIAKWHVEPGQQISEDDPLVDMMTDKAAVEVASPVSGKVRQIHGEAGAMMAVGGALVTLDTADAGQVPEPVTPPAAPATGAVESPEANSVAQTGSDDSVIAQCVSTPKCLPLPAFGALHESKISTSAISPAAAPKDVFCEKT